VDAKDVLAIEDQIAFFFHAQRVVHLVPFLLLPCLPLGRGSIGGIGILGKCLEDKDGSKNGKENLDHC
jgi:hypothetical protein